MSVVNFAITKPLESMIERTIKKYGFSSKAELFRFAIMNYITHMDRQMDEEENFLYLEKKLARLAHEKLSGKKLPSLREQLDQI